MILDTNALSAFVDGDASLADRLNGEARVVIPVIVLGEFRYGISGSRRRRAYEQWLDEFLPDFEILSVTDATAVVYAGVRVALRKAGQPIPAHDAWIAAVALEHRLAVMSRDQHFDAVPGLTRATW